MKIPVNKRTGKPRGYAFIEFYNEADFQCNALPSTLNIPSLIVALDRADGRKVDNRRVVVDYERGRTKQEWVPRRLGGGKGDKRRDRETERIIRDLKKSEPVLAERSRSRSAQKTQVKEEATAVKEETKSMAALNQGVVAVKEESKTQS